MGFVCLSVVLSAALAQSTAKIQGTVHDDSGKPIAGAFALATTQSAAALPTRTTVTDGQGQYTFTNLPAGKYNICIQIPGTSRLGNCEWAAATSATVAASQSLTNPTITIAKGTLFQLRLNDPNQLIAQTDDILLGVYLPGGAFRPMRLASRDAAGRTYDIAVPLSTSFRIGLISAHLQISDNHGAPLASAVLTSVATSVNLTLPGPSSDGLPAIVYTVTGRR